MNEELRKAYAAAEFPVMDIGGILLDNKLLPDSPVNLVLKSFNRHGLIAGATGSGKTKTMQVLCEQLSLAGVPSLVMDIKGDVSGLAVPGVENDFLRKRCQELNVSFTPRGFPVEFLTLNDEQQGVPVKATVADFGPILFSRMLDINETQSGVVTVIFQYAKEEQLPLIDLSDFKALLQYVQTDAGKTEIESRFGGIPSSSIGIITRKIIELETQGGNSFFAEPAFNVMDLMRTTNQGLGIISILRLMDMQDKPKLFSTFMLKLLSDVYRLMPELGDPDKPKLVLFIDEAHLIFKNASKALLNLLETIVKLIRSKGIGLIFSTQTPKDIPDSILSQLGLKIQHALRAFTAKDRQAMKLVAQNFPPTNYYNTEQLLTSLGIGEALLSALDGKGQPTPLIQCMIRPPESRMGALTEQELSSVVQQSSLVSQYRRKVNTRSAAEILAQRKKNTIDMTMDESKKRKPKEKAEPSMIDQLSKNSLFRQLVRQFFRQLTDQLLKILGVKKSR